MMMPNAMKRDRSEHPWRVRAGSDVPTLMKLDAEPRVERRRQPAASQTRKLRSSNTRTQHRAGVDSTLDQVDALQKLLSTAMPPKVVLDNSFVCLRSALDTDIETIKEQEWRSGVEHAQWLADERISELEFENKRIRSNYSSLQREYVRLVGDTNYDWLPPPLPTSVWTPPPLPTSVWEPLQAESEEEKLAADIKKWLDENESPPVTQPPSPTRSLDGVDLDEISRELENLVSS